MLNDLSRRSFLKLTGALAGRVAAGSTLFAVTGCDLTPYGPLEPPDENGIRLPPGFGSRILAVTGEEVGNTGYTWHAWPDGGDVFKVRGGWIYVSNSEVQAGGASAIRFDRNGEVEDAYRILGGTARNCAGGRTPWGTWLSCEEYRKGAVWECDPTGVREAVRHDAMGWFSHEAVAYDPNTGRFYLTEDRFAGRFYRFTPNAWGNLSSGLLEAAVIPAGQPVKWWPIPNPNPDEGAGDTPTRLQNPYTKSFRGGEGIVWDDGHLYFTTKNDGIVWDYYPPTESMGVLYDPADDPYGVLTGVDNITASREGDLIVAEDGGNMQLVVLDKSGVAKPLLRVTGQRLSEMAGPAFDPWGSRIYFSSQRGTDGRGITYEVSGPFRSGRV
jgi:secreted PhoX family phosphatase